MGTTEHWIRVVDGAHAGERFSLAAGTCRVVGRVLPETETACLDDDGNRALDVPAARQVAEHVPGVAADSVPERPQDAFHLEAYTRLADLILEDTSISRAHALLYCDEDGTLGVVDLASTNGTLVNGSPAPAAVLAGGDSVVIGETTVVVDG